jgi:hypothetical protein
VAEHEGLYFKETDAMPNPNEFKGAICAACDSPLDTHGYCTNDACGFASYHQDEPGGWLHNAEREETLDGEDEDDAELHADRLLAQQELEDFEQADEYLGHFGDDGC